MYIFRICLLQIKFTCSFNNARSVFGARYMQHIINILPFYDDHDINDSDGDDDGDDG